MTLDAYGFCLCGSGKKFKFCCCKDLLHELEKVERALEGDQRAGAHEHITRLIADHGPRHALLAMQADACLGLDKWEEAQEAVNLLLAGVPHSPVGLAMQSILETGNHNIEGAIERLQDALENVEQILPHIVYSALGVVGTNLVQTGRFLAGRGHFVFQAGLAGDKDQTPYEILMELSSSPSVPLLWKQDFRFSDAPPNTPWQGEFGAAMKSARRGAWRAACESLASLNDKVRDQACVWRNMAILRGWLGREAQAAEAWHKFASLPGVPQDEAVEAEALATLLKPPSAEDLIDVVKLTYQVPDTDRLMEQLLSDRRIDQLPVDLSELVDEGEPPPKGAFHVFDREMPTSLDGVTSIHQLPTIIAEAYIFGRQTDRDARLEVVLDRNQEFENRQREVTTRLAELLGPLKQTDVVQKISRLRAETAPKRRFPRGAEAPRMMELMREQRRDVYLNRWPDVRLSDFGGKSAREAAQDSKFANHVLGAILNLELANEEAGQTEFEFNELRRSLQLPERGRREVKPGEIESISLASLGRIDFSKLSDDDLFDAYRRLAMHGYRSALYRCGTQVVARPTLSDRLDLEDVFESLASIAPDVDAALQFVDMGRQLSTVRGRSPAKWYLHELGLRLKRFDAAECDRLIRLISTRFAKEPGIAQGLFQLLVSHGLINPDGTPVRMEGGQPAGGQAQPAAAPAASPIWTPDSAASAPKQESKLWLPGQGG